jgi:hypothetical protein
MANATLYLGAVKCGKTYLMRSHVDAIRRQEDPPLIFIFDHTGEWEIDGAKVYEWTGDWWKEPALVSIFRGGSGPRDVARLAIETGWSLYIDDEIDLIVREGKWKDNPLRDIIKRGRHIKNRAGEVCEVGALLATQRPAGIPGDLMGLFECVHVGRLTSEADCDRVRREGWVEGASSFAAVAERLRGLAVGEFIVWPPAA